MLTAVAVMHISLLRELKILKNSGFLVMSKRTSWQKRVMFVL